MVAEQELEHHRRRELRWAAEPGVLGVELAGKAPGGRVQPLRRRRFRPRQGARTAELAGDAGSGIVDLSPAVDPRLGDRVQDLPERRHSMRRPGWEVRAGVERPAIGREEGGHRPSALAGQRLDRLHVHGVDVWPLLAVDLDRHEPRVEVGSGRLVLERLVRHDMAPVARGVSDTEQHRDVAPARLGECVVAPLPPVHGVVGVLEEVRAGRVP